MLLMVLKDCYVIYLKKYCFQILTDFCPNDLINLTCDITHTFQKTHIHILFIYWGTGVLQLPSYLEQI